MVGDGQERREPEQQSPIVAAERGRTVRIGFRFVAPILLALLAALAWTLTVFTAPPPPPAGTPPAQVGGPDPRPGTPQAQDEAPARRYEEADDDGLASSVRMIDLAIIGALKETGQGLSGVHILEVRSVQSGGESFHVQTLELSLEGGRERFMETLGAWLARVAPEAALHETRTELTISARGQVTHRIILEAEPLPMTPLPPKTKARLAIVIDDLGQSAAYASDLARLGFPVGFAIWPLASQSERVAAIAARTGNDVLLHQPMEPRGYPEDDPGRGALFTSMDEAAIRKVLIENLAHFPEAVGVNNHMGSRFTEDRQAMRAVFGELRARGLFYLDSVTTAASVGHAEAARLGIPALRRDVFLDNVADADAILMQLRKAERLAIRNGQAVAIGHPYPETLQALRRWSAMRDERIAVVSLRRLLAKDAAGPSQAQVGKAKSDGGAKFRAGQASGDTTGHAGGKAGPKPVQRDAGPDAGPAKHAPRPLPEQDRPRPIEITPLY